MKDMIGTIGAFITLILLTLAITAIVVFQMGV